MKRPQTLVQWDPRRLEDAEILADLFSHAPRYRARRLRELALLGLRAERGGVALTPPASPASPPAPPTPALASPMGELDDFLGGLLSSLESA